MPPKFSGPRLGLRAQILLGLALVTLFAVLSTGYLTLWAGGASLRIQRESTALALATSAAASAAAVIEPGQPFEAAANRMRLSSLAREVGEQGDVRQVSFIAPGRVPVASHPPRVPGEVDPPLVLAALSGVPPVFNYRERPEGGGMELLAYAPISVSRRVVGVARVSIAAPAPVMVVVRRSGSFLIGLAVADAFLVLGLGYLVLTQLVVRPLQEVERATGRVTAGDWEQRITSDGPREVAALAAAFNQMTASLASQREQLIRTEKLVSVGQLAAGVAHEIGNPLAAVLGLVDILRADAASAPASSVNAAERRDALDRVKAETRRIHRIIQDLLEYSRPSREEAQPTSPLAVLTASRELLAPQARFKAVTVQTEPASDATASAWPNVLVSAGRLQQVFVNLLMNAADAMGGEGTITVRCESAGHRVRLSVSDSGPGIPPELGHKVFDPFFTTKDPGQGTGLGLAISRSIVESYGGTLELSPQAPPGATFVITLPASV